MTHRMEPFDLTVVASNRSLCLRPIVTFIRIATPSFCYDARIAIGSILPAGSKLVVDLTRVCGRSIGEYVVLLTANPVVSRIGVGYPSHIELRKIAPACATNIRQSRTYRQALKHYRSVRAVRVPNVACAILVANPKSAARPVS